MGLDMYLYAKKHVGGWDHIREEEHERFMAVLKAVDFTEDQVAKRSPHVNVEVCVAYWRKANAIHKWFVDNVQGGVDDGRDAYVSRKNLERLLETCRNVLAVAEIEDGQPTPAGTTYRWGQEPEHHMHIGRGVMNSEAVAKLLPTQSGFFFGSVDYGEYYIETIEDTIEQIERALKLEGVGFYYSASW